MTGSLSARLSGNSPRACNRGSTRAAASIQARRSRRRCRAGLHLLRDLIDLIKHRQRLSPRVGIDVHVLVIVVVNKVELVHLKAAKRDDQNCRGEKEKRLIELAQLLIKNFQRVAARQRQRHDEVQSNPGRLVTNQRIGREQTERPLRQKQRKPIVSAPERDQRADAAQDQDDAFFLKQPTNVLVPGMRVLVRALSPRASVCSASFTPFG